MKSLIFVLALLGSVSAFAQNDSHTPKSGPHSVSLVGSFGSGGFNLGAAYEYTYEDSLGVGGHFRFFNKDDDSKSQSDGMFIVGAAVGHHFYKKNWDLAITPSLNVINIDSAAPNADDTTAFGPGLSIALLCQVNNAFAIGIDWANYWAWFDKDFDGKRVDDLGIKARMSF